MILKTLLFMHYVAIGNVCLSNLTYSQLFTNKNCKRSVPFNQTVKLLLFKCSFLVFHTYSSNYNTQILS